MLQQGQGGLSSEYRLIKQLAERLTPLQKTEMRLYEVYHKMTPPIFYECGFKYISGP